MAVKLYFKQLLKAVKVALSARLYIHTDSAFCLTADYLLHRPADYHKLGEQFGDCGTIETNTHSHHHQQYIY